MIKDANTFRSMSTKAENKNYRRELKRIQKEIKEVAKTGDKRTTIYFKDNKTRSWFVKYHVRDLMMKGFEIDQSCGLQGHGIGISWERPQSARQVEKNLLDYYRRLNGNGL